ncbi:MAG TPA: cyanophycin synthetase, partial [Ignavibacteriaceae bacterium]
FLNYDDPLLKKCFSSYHHRTTFGFSKNADVQGKITGYTNDGRPEITINYRRKSFSTASPLYGKSNANNFIAAASIALKLGLNFSKIKNAVNKLKPSSGRLEVIRLSNFTVINDTYNANPESTKAAIELTGRIKNRSRKILILGDMFELGKNKLEFHRNLRSTVLKNMITDVYTIGSSMKSLSGSLTEKKIFKKHFESRSALKNFIRKFDFKGSVVLIKGSRGMKMEEFLEIIKQKFMN